mgnify:CR=1 FL=1
MYTHLYTLKALQQEGMLLDLVEVTRGFHGLAQRRRIQVRETKHPKKNTRAQTRTNARVLSLSFFLSHTHAHTDPETHPPNH